MFKIWFIYSLLSAFFASLVSIFAKIGLKNLDSNLVAFVRSFIMSIFLGGVILIQGKINNVKQILEDYTSLIFVLLSALAGALSWIFYFWALKEGKASQVGAIDKLSVVITLVLAFLFLGEKLSLKGVLGIALAFVSIILIALG